MKLLQSLLLNKPAERYNNLWYDLSQSIPIDVSNVAQYYFYQNSQELWDYEKDFPNCAPPWPLAFFEWKNPPAMNSEGRIIPLTPLSMGCLIKSDKLENLIKCDDDLLLDLIGAFLVDKEMKKGQKSINVTSVQRLAKQIYSILPEGKRREYVNAIRNRNVDTYGKDWIFQAAIFASSNLHKPIWLISGMINNDGSVPIDANGKLLWSLMLDRPPQNFDDGWPQLLHVPMLATSFCHCKNVALVDDNVPYAVSKAFEKRHKMPRITYKTLIINPMMQVLQKEGKLEEHHSIRKAVHICRGHFKDYQERGLFGKYHGLFWWDMHIRGNKASGIVVKDYRVAVD